METDSRIRTAIRALAYVQSFGFPRGLSLFWKTLPGNRCVSLKVPDYPAPLLLRTRTTDIQVFGQVFISKEYDFALPGPEPGLIIDGGAYVGYTTAFFARRYPRARVLAVEPAGENWDLLERNTSAFPNVRVIRGGIWPRKTTLAVGNPDGLHWSFQVGEMETAKAEQNAGRWRGAPPEGEAVEAFTIPDLIEMAGGGIVDILKLDIEGAEKALFAEGCGVWLDHVRVIMIELHDRFLAGCSESFYRGIAGRPFDQLIKGENIAVFFDRYRAEGEPTR